MTTNTDIRHITHVVYTLCHVVVPSKVPLPRGLQRSMLDSGGGAAGGEPVRRQRSASPNAGSLTPFPPRHLVGTVPVAEQGAVLQREASRRTAVEGLLPQPSWPLCLSALVRPQKERVLGDMTLLWGLSGICCLFPRGPHRPLLFPRWSESGWGLPSRRPLGVGGSAGTISPAAPPDLRAASTG